MPLDRAGQERERLLEAELRGQAGAFKPLDPREERALLGRLPDPAASRSLVEHNLDLVVAQAEAHLDRGLLFSDLYQEGTLGLVDALRAYSGRGEFRDFARLHIGLQMDALIQSEIAARKETDEDVADVKTLDMAQAMFRRENRRDATAMEMQKALGWDEGRLERIETMLDLAREHNDAATINFLDADTSEELGIDFSEEQPDPYRRPQGAGPDE
jgi:DNA-directed RNA polymerase sigma subunit (sigma70/sigma32)